MTTWISGYRQSISALLLTSCITLTPAIAAPSLDHALAAYNSGDFNTARDELSELAQYGIVAAHYNLAVMAMKGQSFPVSPGLALGFLKTSAQLGAKIDQALLTQVEKAAVTAQQLPIAEKVVTQFGRQPIINGLINAYEKCAGRQLSSESPFNPPSFTSSAFHKAQLVPGQKLPQPYPTSSILKGQQGIMIATALIDEHGKALDPRIEAIIPQQNNDGFLSAVTEYFQTAKFDPMTVNNLPVLSRYRFIVRFKIAGAGDTFWIPEQLRQFSNAAWRGEPDAQYAAAYISMIDPATSQIFALNTQRQKVGMLLSAALLGVMDAQLDTSNFFSSSRCTETQDIGNVWLEQAARSGQPRAKLLLAKQLLQSDDPASKADQIRAMLSEASLSEDRYTQKHAAFLLATSKVPGVTAPETALQGALKLKGAVKKAQANRTYNRSTPSSSQPAAPVIEVSYNYVDSSDPEQDIVLAAAYAANNNYADAIKIQQRAISKASKIGWNTVELETMLTEMKAKHMPDYSQYYLSWTTDKLNHGNEPRQ